MQQNIKVDMVYYRTPSDFEMEFNLCGCCHMRLLSEKAQDRQSLVRALAKAVSRSRIIIACGPLFDKEGLVSVISTAIGTETQRIDNQAYGINSDGFTEIIKGSTPLVSPDGFFCGCIIESGPQSIIALSDNRDLRKQILKELIHPYIYELSIMPEPSAAQSAPVAVENENESSSENPVPASEQAEPENEAEKTSENSGELKNEENSDFSEDGPLSDGSDADSAASIAAAVAKITASIAAEAERLKSETAADLSNIPVSLAENVTQAAKSEEAASSNDFASENTEAALETKEQKPEEISFVMEDSGESEKEYEDSEENVFQDNAESSLYIESGTPMPVSAAQYAAEYTPSEGDKMFVCGDDDENWNFDYDSDLERKKEKKKISSINTSIVIISVILVLIVVALAYILIYTPYSKGISISTYIQQIFGLSSGLV